MVFHELSVKILDAVFAVHRELGSGLLESCYHNALFYKGQVADEYFAQLLGYLLNSLR